MKWEYFCNLALKLAKINKENSSTETDQSLVHRRTPSCAASKLDGQIRSKKTTLQAKFEQFAARIEQVTADFIENSTRKCTAAFTSRTSAATPCHGGVPNQYRLLQCKIAALHAKSGQLAATNDKVILVFPHQPDRIGN